VEIHLDNPLDGRAALQRLLRLAASNIGGPQASEELSRVVGELRDDPTGARVAWFAQVAAAVTAAAAWRFARDSVDDEPSEDDAVAALHSIELAVEEGLGI
jgi:hypothetical protein